MLEVRAHDTNPSLATPQEVSAYLQIPVRRLQTWRYQDTGPRAVRPGRHLRYRWSDVEAVAGPNACK